MVFATFSLLSLICLLSYPRIPHSNTKILQFISIQPVAVCRTSPPSRPPPDSSLPMGVLRRREDERDLCRSAHPLSGVWQVAGAEGSQGEDPFLTSLD